MFSNSKQNIHHLSCHCFRLNQATSKNGFAPLLQIFNHYEHIILIGCWFMSSPSVPDKIGYLSLNSKEMVIRKHLFSFKPPLVSQYGKYLQE